jgi:hypothetical protein
MAQYNNSQNNSFNDSPPDSFLNDNKSVSSTSKTMNNNDNTGSLDDSTNQDYFLLNSQNKIKQKHSLVPKIRNIDEKNDSDNCQLLMETSNIDNNNNSIQHSRTMEMSFKKNNPNSKPQRFSDVNKQQQ